MFVKYIYSVILLFSVISYLIIGSILFYIVGQYPISYLINNYAFKSKVFITSPITFSYSKDNKSDELHTKENLQNKTFENNFMRLDSKTYVYSGYWDDRYVVPSESQIFLNHYIRIFILKRTFFHNFIFNVKGKTESHDYQCHFYLSNSDSQQTLTVKAKLYETCENHNKQWGSFYLSCLVPEIVSRQIFQPFLHNFATNRSFSTSTNTNSKRNINNESLNINNNAIFSLSIPSSRFYTIKLSSVIKNNADRAFVDLSIQLPKDWISGKSLLYKIYALNKQPYQKHTKLLLSEKTGFNNVINQSDYIISLPLPFDWTHNIELKAAICVPPLYGTINPYSLIQFVEMSYLLGAEHIFFYLMSFDAEMFPYISILQRYEALGRVTLLHWSITTFVSDAENSGIWNYGQSLSIADCHYRNMYEYDILAFNDVDEYIVPLATRTWQQTILAFGNGSWPHKSAGIKIQSAFFERFLGSQVPSLPVSIANGIYSIPGTIFGQNKRTALSSRIRTKCLIAPKLMFEQGIHHMSKQTYEPIVPENANPNYWLLHHYRSCNKGYDMDCSAYTTDYSMHRYVYAFNQRYRKALSAMRDILPLT